MLRSWPYATLCVVVISIALALIGNFDKLSWQREDIGGLWRWVSASFVHYTPLHLAGNSIALLIIGITAEQATSSRFALLTYATAILFPMALLYIALPDIQQFAGSSCLAYAMTGVLVASWWAEQRSAALILLAATFAYQLARLLSEEAIEVRPVWQMHGVAVLIGAMLGGLYNKKG